MKQPPNKKSVLDLVGLALVILAFAVSAWAYEGLPDQVPSHWNVRGEVDGWIPKPFGPFALPTVMLGIYVLLRVVPRISPQGFQVEGFTRAYEIMKIAILGMLLMTSVVATLSGLGYPVPVGRFVQGGVGVLFIVLGNYMGKVTRNFFVGIRTPWTLANEEVWLRTHRLGGRLMVLAGLICVVSALLNVLSLAVLISTVLLAAAAPIAYSYLLYRRLEAKGPKGEGPASG